MIFYWIKYEFCENEWDILLQVFQKIFHNWLLGIDKGQEEYLQIW